ncbi:phage tail protein [Maribacter sp.]
MRNFGIEKIAATISILGALLAIGIWLGSIQSRLNNSTPIKLSERLEALEKSLVGIRDENSSKQMINLPIGSIIPFSSDLDKIGDDIKTKWKLCDGKELRKTEYKELYGLIGKSWGNASSGNFKIPDLRGVFLRGADLGRGLDLDKESRVNGENKIGGIGSFQEDQIGKKAFDSHSHSIGRGQTVDDQGGGRNRGDYIHLSEKESYEMGGSETRPKNVYINFLIKVK